MNIMKYKTDCRDIHRMAYPILLNYVLSGVFEMLDKAIVGHYSVRGFAVVGIAASFTFAITGALGILSAAFNIVAAGERGCQDEHQFESTFAASKSLALLTGTVFFVLSLLGGRFFFRHVYGIREDDLSELLSYYYPAAFTVIQNMLIFQYSTYFRNRLNTRITLCSTIVSTGVNLFFDCSLVYGFFGMPCLGTAGAAWGSVIGLAAGLLVFSSHTTARRCRQNRLSGVPQRRPRERSCACTLPCSGRNCWKARSLPVSFQLSSQGLARNRWRCTICSTQPAVPSGSRCTLTRQPRRPLRCSAALPGICTQSDAI